MQSFIWVAVIGIGLEVLAKIICLTVGYFPPRNKGAVAIDVVVGVGLIIWGAVLLHGA